MRLFSFCSLSYTKDYPERERESMCVYAAAAFVACGCVAVKKRVPFTRLRVPLEH